jgi:hypothetical protein
VSGDFTESGVQWDRRRLEQDRFARLERRLDTIDERLKEIHDERERAKGVQKFLVQIAAVATGVLGSGWVLIQIARVVVHGL